MFANYDYTNFPLVKIDLSGNIENNDDFLNFTNQWLELYNNKKYFEFIFDTSKCGLINAKYCIYTALFIKKIMKIPIVRSINIKKLSLNEKYCFNCSYKYKIGDKKNKNKNP